MGAAAARGVMKMFGFLESFHPVVQALFGTIFTWGVTALGAGMVFFFKSINLKVLDIMLGFDGGLFLRVVDRVLPHLHLGLPIEKAEGVRTHWQRSILLVLAITLHNIPEGLAVGVAFGVVAAGIPGASLGAAVALAIGIGL
jgi:ZIP family zinc transporter